jgi:hypothetical protein
MPQQTCIICLLGHRVTLHRSLLLHSVRPVCLYHLVDRRSANRRSVFVTQDLISCRGAGSAGFCVCGSAGGAGVALGGSGAGGIAESCGAASDD